MKKTRKTAVIVAVSCMTGMLFFSSSHAETPSPKIIGISDILQSKEGWDDIENLINAENGELTREASKLNDVFAYTGKKYSNELFNFNVSYAPDPKDWSMKTIILRSGEGAKGNMWDSSQSYAINFNPGSIELQRYSSGQFQLGSWAADIKIDEKNNVLCGAFEVDGGVQILAVVNGKQVMNYYDKENPVKKEGYLGFSAHNGFTLENSESIKELDNTVVAQYIAPYNIKDEKLMLSYDTVGKEGNQTFNWYAADTDIDQDAKVFKVDIINDRDKLMKKINGFENKKELDLTDDLVGKYIYVCFENEKGEKTFTNGVYVDPVMYKLSKDIYMVTACEKAYVNGNFMLVDKENDLVTPDIFNDTLYLPLRFLAESLNGDVSWDNATRTVHTDVNGIKAEINADSGEAYINGEKKTFSDKPVIAYDRTMLTVKDCEELFGVQTEVTDDLIFIGNKSCSMSDSDKLEAVRLITDSVIK